MSGSVGRVGGGALADRVSLPASTANARVLVGQAALAAACFVAVTLVGPPLPAAVAFFALGLFILGFPGVFYGCLTALVDDEEVGAATAGGHDAGGLLAPPAFGYVADAVGYRPGWYALAAFALAAGAAALPLARG